MKLDEIYSKKTKPIISFEVYPPKDDLDGVKKEHLLNELKKLKLFNPDIISITYGAGGSNREGTLVLVEKIKNELQIEAMPHFTCICSSKDYIENHLKEVKNLGVENILALRGDEPKEINVCYRDFLYANELVEFIKKKTDLSIAVAGYPECHSACQNLDKDIENLKRKVDAGASAIYTQLFFNNDYFFRYKELVRDAGINIPIVAGILPIVNYTQLQKMADMCKIEIPQILVQKLEKYKEDNKATVEIGIDFASYQIQQLIDAGVEGLHFYTLNKAYSTEQILENVLPQQLHVI